MEPEARKRYEAIDAVLQSIAESQKASAEKAEVRMAQFETRMALVDRRMDRVDARMDRADARMDRAEERMDKYQAVVLQREARLDKRMNGITKLIQVGMKMIVHNEAQQAKAELEMTEIRDKLNALITVVDGIVKRPRPNSHPHS